MRRAIRIWPQQAAWAVGLLIGLALIVWAALNHGFDQHAPGLSDAAAIVGSFYVLLGGALWGIGVWIKFSDEGYKRRQFVRDGKARIYAREEGGLVNVYRKGGGWDETRMQTFKPDDAEAAIEFVVEKRAALCAPDGDPDAVREAQRLAKLLNRK